MTLGIFIHYFNFYFFKLKLIFSIILYFTDNKYVSNPQCQKTELYISNICIKMKHSYYLILYITTRLYESMFNLLQMRIFRQTV